MTDADHAEVLRHHLDDLPRIYPYAEGLRAAIERAIELLEREAERAKREVPFFDLDVTHPGGMSRA